MREKSLEKSKKRPKQSDTFTIIASDSRAIKNLTKPILLLEHRNIAPPSLQLRNYNKSNKRLMISTSPEN